MKFTYKAKIIFYSLFLLLYSSGFLIWLSEQQTERSPNYTWFLKTHGVTSLLFFIMWGYLLHAHILPGIKKKRQRNSGLLNMILILIIMVTVPGLYYVAHEEARKQIALAHTYLGFLLIVPLGWHIRERYKK